MSTDLRTVILAAGALQVRGTSSYTLRLAEILPDFGFAPVIVTPSLDGLPDDVRPTCPTHEYRMLASPMIRPLFTGIAAKDVSASNPCLVHIQSRHALAFGLSLSRRLNLPCLITLHDHSPPRIATSQARLKRLIAVSSSVKAELTSKQAINEKLITVIHSGVRVPDDVDNSEVLRAKRTPVIGAAGHLEPSKGFPFFLEAARKVLDAGHHAEFLIAGSGPEERNLRALARQLELTANITFIPDLPEFQAAIRAMDVFCLPSVMQGLGTVMIEAMSLGRPVVASAVGGITSIVKDNETALLVPPSDSGRMAERIIELIQDPIRARAIGSAARIRVIEAFDATRMTELTVDEYETALGTKVEGARSHSAGPLL